MWIMKVGWSFADTCTAFQCFQNSPEIFAGLPISSNIFGGINTNYCSTVWIMMIGTIVGVKHSTLSFLQIPLKEGDVKFWENTILKFESLKIDLFKK